MPAMERLHIVDTWPDYAGTVRPYIGDDPSDLLDRWLVGYMARWPELLRLQQECYRTGGHDWRAVALERVSPHLAARHDPMAAARDALLEVLPSVVAGAERVFGEALQLTCVIYVGMGCGAGWATHYEGRAAVLFGLENMAECGWTDRDSAFGLAAHEIGHLQHAHLRRAAGVEDGSGPLWHLYSEGFAQRFEHTIAGPETWHMASSAWDWLPWCRANRAHLAAEFLRRVDAGEDTRPFFGSWFEIEGHSETGYYLGHEMLKDAERSRTLAQLTVLTDVELQRIGREWLGTPSLSVQVPLD